jgi:hypothetical protein
LSIAIHFSTESAFGTFDAHSDFEKECPFTPAVRKCLSMRAFDGQSIVFREKTKEFLFSMPRQADGRGSSGLCAAG